MKSISLLASLAAASVICIAAGCSSSSDSNGSGGTGATGGSGNGTAGSSNGGKGGGTAGSKNGAAGDDTSAAGDNGTGATTGAAGDGNGAAGDSGNGATACGSGSLLLGAPNGDPVTGVSADPTGEVPVIIGNTLFLENEEEIWSADLTAKPPTLKKFAGTKGSGFINAGVACADTTFLVIRDMAATPDGKLVVVDYVGGAVIEITNPGAANCTSAYVAGTHAKTADPGSEYPLAQGDMDGPGAGALFGGVGTGGGGIHKLSVDADGNIYTYDDGTGKFKMIANDADRTVSTIGQGTTSDNVLGVAYLGGKVYATGVDGTNDFLEVADPSTYKAATPKGNVKELFRNRGDQFPEVSGSGHQAITSSLIADGDGLIVASQYGYIWRLDTTGKVVATLAGTGPNISFSSDFDPTVAHPASEWELVYKLSDSNGGPWITKNGSTFLFSGANEPDHYVVKFSCP